VDAPTAAPRLRAPHWSAGAASAAPRCSSDLQEGSSSWLPFLGKLIGQAPGGASAGGSFLGCLAHKEWAVRKAAADALRTGGCMAGGRARAAAGLLPALNP
jgi:hypothetical protein